MSTPQNLLFIILALTLLFFIWGKIRYDLVAIIALLSAYLLQIIPASEVFSGLPHPAVITVAAVLIISKALQNSGALDVLATQLVKTSSNRIVYVSTLMALGALMSAFMNNVGALALLMPLALKSCAENKIPPALVLMPLSFGTILGGLMTQMGTPPNIIIANYREELSGEPFSVFDFAPVGVCLAVIGLLFLVTFSYLLIPKARRGKQSPEELFEINDYIVEAKLNADSAFIGKTIDEVEEAPDDFEVIGILRGQQRLMGKRRLEKKVLQENDILILETNPGNLNKSLQKLGLTLAGEVKLKEEDLDTDEVSVIEAVISPGSRMERQTFQKLRLRSRYGIGLLGLARQGRSLKQRISHVSLRAGDILLIQGETITIHEILSRFGCLPLAQRGLKIGKTATALWPIISFAAALCLSALGWVPVHIAFCLAVALLALTKTFPLREAYDSIDWSIIVLLAAMIPLGHALESTGSTTQIASSISQMAIETNPVITLALMMVITMTLSDIMNNTATAIIMAPIAAGIAQQLGLNPDAFLMAVAIGASCAFLTPIGHQNNILVMGPGGYRFGDYWRLGLPLEIIIVVTGVPLICWVWPL